MRFTCAILIFLFGLQGLYCQEAVLYGNRAMVLSESENTSRIFFDKRGDMYPDMIISDAALEASQGTLNIFFRNNVDEFIKVSRQYGMSSEIFSESNYGILQDAIQKRNLSLLHGQLSVGTELFVLVHGFRKPLQSMPRSSSAFEDNESIKSSISTYRSNAHIHFLEVYWDATFIPIPGNLGSLIRMGKLFKKSAIPNATCVGLGLRSFVSKIDLANIHIISHSLGAQVVNNCLFNANVKSSIPTPPQDNITVCLVAPAIARKPFRSFYKRVIHRNYQNDDNYHYAIIYNERDIVIAKSNPSGKRKFRFTRFFGNTKLGCNCAKEAIKVSKLFGRKYPGSNVALMDATLVGRDHRWKAYAQSIPFREYIERLE